MITNYKDTENFLFNQLPMFQRIGPKAFKSDLKNIQALDDMLGHPHTAFKSIHIAGTNGKGSTSFFIASALHKAGYKVGLYTSPHYRSFRERIRVNGEMVSKKFVTSFVNRIVESPLWSSAFKPSFFEITVAMAFSYFKEEEVDFAVVETGLGGRLDSTNVITPEMSVITNIDLDHTAFLGDTIEAIAAEKAGIIKENIPVVIGRNEPVSMAVFRERSRKLKAPLILAENFATEIPRDVLSLYPDYQRENMATAVAVLKTLTPGINDGLLKKAWTSTLEDWAFTGRYTVLGESPRVIADSAHNQAGMKALMDQIGKESFDALHIVLAMVNDKDMTGLLELLPRNATYYFSAANIPRALPADKLLVQAAGHGLTGRTYSTVRRALAAARRKAKPTDLVLVSGSIFTVAEIV